MRVRAEGVTYELDSSWPKLPPGMFFGTEGGPKPNQRGPGGQVVRDTTYADGVSGLAIGGDDNVYVFNRGQWPVMIFDTAGNLLDTWGAGQFVRPSSDRAGPAGSSTESWRARSCR